MKAAVLRRARMSDENLGAALGTLWARAEMRRMDAVADLEQFEERVVPQLIVLADHRDDLRERAERAHVEEARVIRFVTRVLAERRDAREERSDAIDEAVMHEIEGREAP